MWPNFLLVVYKEREMQLALSKVVDSCAQNFCFKNIFIIHGKLHCVRMAYYRTTAANLIWRVIIFKPITVSRTLY